MQRKRACSLYLLIFLAATGVGVHAPASAAPEVDESQPTEAALRAITDHWGSAEVDGDLGYLERLFAPEYRSVGSDGRSVPRAKILEHARRNQGSAEARAAERKRRDAYVQAHPTEKLVVIHGQIGIVSYFNAHRGVDSSIRGSDVLVYEGHGWRAVYSLHNGVE
jgi:hypothetical protein